MAYAITGWRPNPPGRMAMAKMSTMWETDADGSRVLVISELSGEKRTRRIPYDVCASRLPSGTYGDKNVTEWAIGKWANDDSTFEGRVKKLTTGPDRNAVHAEIERLTREAEHWKKVAAEAEARANMPRS
jgi:hypothetical protein